MNRAISLAAMLVVLAGCAVGPNYRSPALPVAPSWRLAPEARAATGPWWTAFGDPVLDRLEAEALANNLTIEQALARLDQSRGMLRAADAALRPSGQADATVARSQQSLNSGLGQLSRYVPTLDRKVDLGQIELSGSWDLDFAGGLRRLREGALADEAATVAGVEAARLAVASDLADAYISLRAAEVQRSALRRLVAMVEDQHRIMVVRVRTGAAPAEALQSQTATLKNDQALLAALDSPIEAQRNRIAVLTGRSPSLPSNDFAGAGVVPNAPDPAAGVPADILHHRPDVLVAEQKLIAANAGIGSALAEYYPKFSLSALIGQESNSLGLITTGDSTIAQGAFGLRWRLFDFDRIAAQVRIAAGRNREALATYRDVVLRASEDVETAFAQLHASRLKVALLTEHRTATAAVAASAVRALRSGEISRDESITAELAVAQAEIDLASARGDEARAVVACERALGASTSDPSKNLKS
jgi:NodT family efflux transporter outer membrane factor (OMF) lipoprotein